MNSFGKTFVVLFGATLGMACGGRAHVDPVGVSTASASARPSPQAGAASVATPSDGSGSVTADSGASGSAAFSLPADYHGSFTRVHSARFVSRGHAAGRWSAEVWANDAARAALTSHSRAAAPGALVIEEHYERGASPASTPSAIMVMEKMPSGYAKEHGDWRWAAFGSQGQLAAEGVIESCAGCHDDAPMDGLFPIVE